MVKRIILILWLGLSGCAFVVQDLSNVEYNNLVYGMSKDQVAGVLGKAPKESQEVIVGKEYEVWEYPVNKSGDLKLNSMGTFTHKIFFLDGKLVRWDKDSVYAQPSFEFQETRIPEAPVSADNDSQIVRKIK
ncbi:MAG TPA: hypothetical protein PL125_02935 [Candidatus Omnitrophota bacterium]|nr:hypothetical protein [Candidatus Omnitrophota bacterium]HPT39136.1 hypothetical protein [Candidatus Omnitrophota bacterium]